MHILDILKPKSRPKYGRRKTIDGGSIALSSHANTTDRDEPNAWDPWSYERYNAVDGLPSNPNKRARPSTAGLVTVRRELATSGS